MHIITGGTGQIGSVLAEALLKKGEPVTIVSRSSKAAAEWKAKGARFAVADIYDTDALHGIFKTGKSIFLLNPPADPMTDTTVQERKTVASLLAALKHTKVEKVVAASTLGAQPGDNIGDLGVLYELEQGVANLSFPYGIIRSGYYMSNWAQSLPSVKKSGELISFLPADLKIPMVSPQDIGELAARLMTEKNVPELTAIQGPELYSPQDVATAFSRVFEKQVTVKVIPQEDWVAAFKSAGFSDKAAVSYANMTKITVQHLEIPKDFVKGKTSLQEYINNLVTENS
jgi:uncharacterized protein YbjT (DUF2867 family)